MLCCLFSVQPSGSDPRNLPVCYLYGFFSPFVGCCPHPEIHFGSNLKEKAHRSQRPELSRVKRHSQALESRRACRSPRPQGGRVHTETGGPFSEFPQRGSPGLLLRAEGKRCEGPELLEWFLQVTSLYELKAGSPAWCPAVPLLRPEDTRRRETAASSPAPEGNPE